MKKGIKLLATVALVLSYTMVVNLGSASATAVRCTDKVYNKGDSGACVKYIQTLNNVFAPSFANRLSVDGVFGTNTDKSIRRLQSNWGLKSDGNVGNNTWNLLCINKAGWYDANGKNHMSVTNWPLSTAKSAGCSKYWRGMIVDGVQY